MGEVETVSIDNIVLDSTIYPRSGIDYKRVSMFEENMRDGFEFEPIHLQEHPDAFTSVFSLNSFSLFFY